MKLMIRKGRPDEINTALELLSQAAIWLREKHIDYWQNWLNPPALHMDWIQQGFDNREFLIPNPYSLIPNP